MEKRFLRTELDEKAYDGYASKASAIQMAQIKLGHHPAADELALNLTHFRGILGVKEGWATIRSVFTP